MRRFAIIAGVLVFLGPLAAQEQIVSTRVYAEPAGAQFLVDGKTYLSGQVFLWPKGSKHTLSVDPAVQTGVRQGYRYTFSGWTDATGAMAISTPTVSVTAHPDVPWIRANITVEVAVRVVVVDCPESENLRCMSPGKVSVGGTLYDRTTVTYTTPNSELQLAAYPNPGYVFAGWNVGGMSDAFLTTIYVTGPTSVQPRFEQGKQVTLLTEPPELQVSADRQPLVTPVTMEWGQGTRHVLGAPSPQDDLQGRTWVFDSWAHGGGQNTAYTVQRTNEKETLTARFIPGARIALLTNPTGLSLKVEGRMNWPSYHFIWGVGTTHEVSAPSEQKDASGRRYVFKGWSNGGPATQQLTVPTDAATDGVRLTAMYESLNRVNVQSSPSGLPLQVDGAECRTPCTVERSGGASIRVSAPASIPASDGTRFDFEGWADGGGAERAWTVNDDGRTLTARYRPMYRLATLVEPEGGALIRMEPASADAFYPAGTSVQVAAEPCPGFRFRAWDGDLSGPYRSGVLALGGPKIVRALLDRVPYVAETGVRNAAGETPVVGVAAGSIVSILGASLATAYEAGPASPLAQALGGVTVRVDGRLLPLVFVSPEQINAQLPSDLEEGTRKLAVRWEGQPDATAEFTVVRNAPGLYARQIEGRPFAVAAHEDGSAVSAEKPARPGETLSIYGTGFGPYLRRPPDGFAVPAAPAYPLEDPVTVVAGELEAAADFAGAAPGQVGSVLVSFRLPEKLAGGPSVDLKVRVNGQESNTVQLAVEQVQ